MKQVKLKNVDINVINGLLQQSLEVNNQLIFEFSPDLLKSISFSSTQSFLKLWSIKVSDLIKTKSIDDNENTDELFPNEIINDSLKNFNETFNFYLLKGDLLKNFLSVFKNDLIDIDFNLIDSSNGKLQTESITVYGKTEADRELVATLPLTTEEMISNKVSDFSQLLTMCQPKENMTEIILPIESLKELRKIISNMTKSISNNSSFVTFKLNDNKLNVSDKVFDLTFDDLIINNYNEFAFNIMKNDFKLMGNHSFKIYSSNNDNHIHFGAQYGKSIIWCLTVKPIASNDDLTNNDNKNDVMSSDDINSYGLEDLDFDDEDDLPF